MKWDSVYQQPLKLLNYKFCLKLITAIKSRGGWRRVVLGGQGEENRGNINVFVNLLKQ